MIGKVSRVAAVLAVLGALVLAAVGVRMVEQVAGPLGYDYAVVLSYPDLSVPDDEFVAAVQGVAEAQGVVLEHTAPVSADSLDDLYYVTGPGSQHLLAEGTHRRFAGGEVRYASLADLPAAGRAGGYLVRGPASAADALMATFSQLGTDPTLVTAGYPVILVAELSAGVPGSLTLVLVFVLLCLGTAGAVLQSRTLGVLDLQGRAPVGAWCADAAAVTGTAVTAMVCAAPVVAAGAWAVDGAAHLGLLVTTWAALTAGAVALVLTGHALGTVLARAVPVLARVNGQMRSTAVHLVVYSARVLAVVLVVGSGTQCLAQAQQYADRVSDPARWHRAEDATVLGLNDTSTTRDQARTLTRELGSWLVGREKAGTAMLVSRGVVGEFDLGAAPAVAALPLLTVDSTYLRRNPVLGTDGRAVAADPREAEVLVLVPQGSAVDTARLTGAVSDTVQAQGQLVDRFGGDPVARRTDFTVRAVTVAAGQQSFVYASPSVQDSDPVVRGAVLVVLPSGLPMHSYDSWVAWMSQGAVLVDGRSTVLDELRREGLAGYVTSVASAAELNRHQTADARARFATGAVAFFASVLAAVLAAIAFAVVHVRRHRDRIFACHVHGWGFWARHRTLVVVDAAVVCAVVAARATALAGQRRAETVLLGASHGAELSPPVLALGTVAAVAVLMAVLALAARGAVRERSGE